MPPRLGAALRRGLGCVPSTLDMAKTLGPLPGRCGSALQQLSPVA
jgi:hypothetical protein